MKDYFEGAVLGAAIGDALGVLTTNLTKEDIKKLYKKDIIDSFCEPASKSVLPHLKKGMYSHKTQMLKMVLENLVKYSYFNPYAYIEDLKKWVKDEKNHRYPSPGHLNAALGYLNNFPSMETEEMKKLKKYAEENILTPKEEAALWEKLQVAPVKSSDIDGALPCLVFGLFRYYDLDSAYEMAYHFVSLTHSSEIVKDIGGIYAVATALTVSHKYDFTKKELKLGFLDELLSFSQNQEVKEHLNLLYNLIKEDVNELKAQITLGNSSYATESFSLGLYYFLTYPLDFKTCVVKAVNACEFVEGDMSAIGYISGSLNGAYNGYSKIDKEFLDELEDAYELKLLADKLYELVGH